MLILPAVVDLCSLCPVVLSPGEAALDRLLLPTFDECPPVASLLRRRSPLVVPEYQMLGGVSTAAAIPLQGILPMDGVGWWYVGLDVLEVSSSVQREAVVSGDPRLACLSPLLVPIPLVGPQMEEGGSGAA